MAAGSSISGKPQTPSVALIVSAFAVVYLVWGSTYLAIRFGIESLPPFLMGGARFLLAGLPLYGVMRLRKRARPTLSNWMAAARVGTLMLVGGNGLVCWAEQYVASGLAALLIATVPLWMVLIDWLLYRNQRPVPRVVFGLLGGLAGLVVLIGPSSLGGDRIHLAGGFALMCACVFWSLGSLHSRRSNLPGCPFLSTATQMIAGGVAFVVLGTVAGEWSRVDLPAVSMRSWLAVAYLSIFGSILALTAYTWLLRVVPPARVATYAYVNPVVAMLLGYAIAGEPLSSRALVASAIILGSVVMITTAPTRRILGSDRNAANPNHDDLPRAERASSTQDVRSVEEPATNEATCVL